MAKGKKFDIITRLGGVAGGVGVGKGIDYGLEMLALATPIDPLIVNGAKVLIGAVLPVFVKNDVVEKVCDGLFAQGLDKGGDTLISGIGATDTYAYVDRAPAGNGQGLKGTR